MTITAEEPWPALPYEAWKDTYTTLHMWTQVVGKIALARALPLNHSWAVALHITPRGLSTRILPHGSRSFSIRFDFIAHRLVIEASDGTTRTLELAPRTVADFYQELMETLNEMGLPVKIWPAAVEIPTTIRLDEDRQDKAYDPVYANRFWRILVEIDRVFTASQRGFVGKASPVHFFWGAFDLAVSRFSGRPAPLHPGGMPNIADWVMQEAYSHEVASAGFWPGAGLGEAAFYAYLYPEPAGYAARKIRPDAAYYSDALKEFILPYEAVRTAADPDRTLLEFLQSSYECAADLAGWDRAALERDFPRT